MHNDSFLTSLARGAHFWKDPHYRGINLSVEPLVYRYVCNIWCCTVVQLILWILKTWYVETFIPISQDLINFIRLHVHVFFTLRRWTKFEFWDLFILYAIIYMRCNWVELHFSCYWSWILSFPNCTNNVKDRFFTSSWLSKQIITLTLASQLLWQFRSPYKLWFWFIVDQLFTKLCSVLFGISVLS